MFDELSNTATCSFLLLSKSVIATSICEAEMQRPLKKETLQISSLEMSPRVRGQDSKGSRIVFQPPFVEGTC